MSSLKLAWTASLEDDNFENECLPIWLGEGRILMAPNVGDWHLLDLKNQSVTLVWEDEEKPRALKEGEPLTQQLRVIPNAQALDAINRQLTGRPELPTQLHQESIVRYIPRVINPSSLYFDESNRSQAVSAWKYYQLISLPELNGDEQTCLPSIWAISLNEEEIGEFISIGKPFLVWDETQKMHYILVQRWDNAFDIFEYR